MGADTSELFHQGAPVYASSVDVAERPLANERRSVFRQQASLEDAQRLF